MFWDRHLGPATCRLHTLQAAQARERALCAEAYQHRAGRCSPDYSTQRVPHMLSCVLCAWLHLATKALVTYGCLVLEGTPLRRHYSELGIGAEPAAGSPGRAVCVAAHASCPVASAPISHNQKTLPGETDPTRSWSCICWDMPTVQIPKTCAIGRGMRPTCACAAEEMCQQCHLPQ